MAHHFTQYSFTTVDFKFAYSCLKTTIHLNRNQVLRYNPFLASYAKVKNLIKGLSIAPDYVRLSVVTFSNSSETLKGILDLGRDLAQYLI